MISPWLATDITETLHTIIIPTQPALQVESLIPYQRAVQPSTSSPLGLMDLKSYDPLNVSAQAKVFVRSMIVNQGPWDVAIETFSFLLVGGVVVVSDVLLSATRQWRIQGSNCQVAPWMETKMSFLCIRINLSYMNHM